MIAQPVPGPRVAIYCRVSTERQEEEGTSLETQEARQRQYCNEHGYEVTAVYRETYSGFELRQSQLDRLRESVRSGVVDIVVCYAVDRLSRNQAHLAILLQEMDDAGVRYEFVTEAFEDSAVGKFILSARAFAAELEREKIAERTQRGRLARLTSGKLPGFGAPPFGYAWSPDRTQLEIDPTTAPLAVRIFRLYEQDGSLRGVATAFTQAGIPSPSGNGFWSMTTVRKIISNPAYMGEYHAQRWDQRKVRGRLVRRQRPEGERIILSCPALIEPATWHEAQRRLADNREHKRREVSHPDSHLLRGGHAVCGTCGRPLAAGSLSPTRPVYLCTSWRNGDTCTWRGNISAAAVDADIWARIAKALANPEVIAQQLDAKVNQPDAGTADLVATDRALAEIDRQCANLVQNMALVTGSAADLVAARLTDLSRQREQMHAERERLVKAAEARRAAQARARDLVTYLRRVRTRLAGATLAHKRLALVALGVRVTVYPAGAVPEDLDERYRVESTINLDDPTEGMSKTRRCLSFMPVLLSGVSCPRCRHPAPRQRWSRR